MARPETLMQWIYSEEFVGGGLLLSLLVIGCGLNVVQAILSSILIAAGAVKMTAAITSLSLLPALLVVSIFTYLWGAVGAALSALCIPFFALVPCSVKIVRLFGGLLTKRSMFNIGLAGTLMFLVDALIPERDGMYLLLHLISLAAYGASLYLSGEITHKELTFCLPWRKAT
jgi:O-antigen/teichoic acid export membrane protein